MEINHKFILILLWFIFMPFPGRSQLIPDNLTLSLKYGVIETMGEESQIKTIGNIQIIDPFLFPIMEGNSIELLVKKRLKWFNVGIAFKTKNLTSNGTFSRDKFNRTDLNFIEMSPLLQFSIGNNLLQNRLRLLLDIRLIAGLNSLTFKDKSYNIIVANDTLFSSVLNGVPNSFQSIIPRENWKSLSAGIFGGLTISYLISDRIGPSFTFGYSKLATKSKIYPDKTFEYLSYQFGLFFRILKEKQYYYY